MSNFEVKVRKISDVYHHPNADRLDVVKVDDYNCITLRNEYAVDDLIVYIPEAAIVPEWLLKEIGLEGKLAGKDKNRVKAMKLRGILSQGLIVPVVEYPFHTHIDEVGYDAKGMVLGVSKPAPENENVTVTMFAPEGTDVTEFLGITKHIPVIPTSMSGEVFNAFGKTINFDIENIKRFPDVFEEGEEVMFTEKLHGTWCCFGYHPEIDHPVITSKGLSQKGLAFKVNEENEKRNLYVRMFNSIERGDGCLNILDSFIEANDYCNWDGWKLCGDMPIYILGEIFGAGVQDLSYGNLPKQFRIFDIYIGEPGHGMYMDAPRVEDTVRDMNTLNANSEVQIEYVPVLYRGPFSKKVLDEYTNGTETVSGTNAHIREGVVIRPTQERRHDEIGRVILKSVSEDYLLRKGSTTEYA